MTTRISSRLELAAAAAVGITVTLLAGLDGLNRR
jgi:hypothetical protein